MTVFEELQNKCKEAGVKLGSVCANVGIPLSSIYWWRKQEPNQIIQLRKIEEEIERLKK
jgi:hypothetical protein